MKMHGFNMNTTYMNLLRLAGCGVLATVLQLQCGCTYETSSPPQGASDQTQTEQAQTDQAPEQYAPPPQPVMTEYQQDLDPYGSWVAVGDYGQCWCPSNQPNDWQPYTVGHWEYSDAGWTWVAE